MQDLRDKVILLTGSTDGLGRALAQALAAQGACVLLHGRDAERLEALRAELAAAGAVVRSYLADFSDLTQVMAMLRHLQQHETRLDVLINNAGLGLEAERRRSVDGHEQVFQVNYLVPWLLSQHLAGLLAASGGRIINIASNAQFPLDLDDLMSEKQWHPALAYGKSKLALICASYTQAEELAAQGIAVAALHPATLMPSKMIRGWFEPQDSFADGVRHVLQLLQAAALTPGRACYFDRAQAAEPHAQAQDAAHRAQLQVRTRDLLQAYL